MLHELRIVGAVPHVPVAVAVGVERRERRRVHGIAHGRVGQPAHHVDAIGVVQGVAVGDDAWTVRVYYKPFVDWIWGGCLLMALGGFFAVIDRRYRVTSVAAASAATAAPVTA